MALFVFFFKNCFALFSPPFFGQDIRVNKETCYRTFLRRFFIPTFFAGPIRVFLEKLFGAFFPPFFVHDIRMNIKNVFSQFSETIFFLNFFAGTIRVFLEKFFHAFFPPISWSRYSCEYKKRVFALF